MWSVRWRESVGYWEGRFVMFASLGGRGDCPLSVSMLEMEGESGRVRQCLEMADGNGARLTYVAPLGR